MSMGSKIRHYRTLAGMTQSELGERGYIADTNKPFLSILGIKKERHQSRSPDAARALNRAWIFASWKGACFCPEGGKGGPCAGVAVIRPRRLSWALR